MKKYFSVFLVLSLSVFVLAQKHDNVWVMGYDGGNSHLDLGRITFDFGGDTVHILQGNSIIDFRKTCASISDAEGKLLFYSNGITISDASHHIMENGDSLTNFTFTLGFSGLNVLQAVLIIPTLPY